MTKPKTSHTRLAPLVFSPAYACVLMVAASQGAIFCAFAQSPAESLSLERSSLTTGLATGRPDGGTFDYQTANPTGGTIGMLTSTDQTSNPNSMSLPDPGNPNHNGSPAQGGFGSYTATYNVNGVAVLNTKDDPFRIPTFGMSCYNSSLESEWGVVGPNTCQSVTIHGHIYSGTMTNPHGYPGTYCSSFVAEVVLQGSGMTNAGKKIQNIGNVFQNVTKITGADGTAVVPNRTVARDRTIIPGRGVKVSVDGVGNDLLANDTGNAIVNYRLDYYRGFGNAVCAGYPNPMAVSACTPNQGKCAGYAFPTGY